MSDSKDQILDQAKELFQRMGYQKTTLTDIARKVGKVKTAIYYYFGNKEEIFSQVVKQESMQLVRRVEVEVAKQTTPTKKLDRYIHSRVELMSQLLQPYMHLKQEVFEMFPIIEKNRAEAYGVELKMVRGILEEINDSGEYRVENVDKAAGMLVNSLKGFEIQMFVTDTMTFDDMEDLKKFILFGVLNKA